MEEVGKLVRSSHERWDGRGYPDRLSGPEIPLGSRIIFVCSAFQDMTSERAYREGKLYCCVVLDAFSRLVVGWSIESTQTTLLVLNALGMATQRREHRDGVR